MNKQSISVWLGITIFTFLMACESSPKVIEGESIGIAPSIKKPNKSDSPAILSNRSDEHQVKVKEVLNTEKYTYLNVTEKNDNFWIAIPKKDVEVGGTYTYSGGLLKKNFKSKEYNRVFETLYLVSNISPYQKKEIISKPNEHPSDVNSQEISDEVSKEGKVKLSELFSNPGKYEGKIIRVSGTCVKVNPMIMNRNWIHIQDGSGEGLDLTITTNEIIEINTVVSLEGKIALNKDFGAGYRYDIIMEEAMIK